MGGCERPASQGAIPEQRGSVVSKLRPSQCTPIGRYAPLTAQLRRTPRVICWNGRLEVGSMGRDGLCYFCYRRVHLSADAEPTVKDLRKETREGQSHLLGSQGTVHAK